MAKPLNNLEKYIAEDIRKYRGISYPVGTGLLRRLLVKQAKVGKIHPNPRDEFSQPEVGPNMSIINQYVQQLTKTRYDLVKYRFDEPLLVQRMKPDGYMLLNGHHRWAAAVHLKVNTVPIRIVNLTQGKDVDRMLKSSGNSKRVSLDLDEVVFNRPAEETVMRHDQLRRGVPALFHFLKECHYDIWLYSAKYDSMDDVRRFFRRYRIRIDGIVTGQVQGRPGIEEVRERLDTLMTEKYTKTVHIDGTGVLCIDRQAKKFADYTLSGREDTWSEEIMDVMTAYEKQ